MNEPTLDPAVLIPDDEVFIRMNRAERWQHGLLVASFILLAVTGLPLMSGEVGVIRLLVGRGGFHALRGILHRAGAVVLITDLVWHALYTLLNERGRRNFREKLPRLKDIKDVFATIGHNSDLSGFLRRRGLFRRFFERHPYWRFDQKPEFGRNGFVEKFEYWSFLWGSTVMILTGFFMWGPGLSLRLFPLRVHQVFVVIHGYEAILAVLAIIIWHMYTVHLKPEVFPMSRVWLDGKITGADLRRFHPLEYRRVLEERERLFRELLALEPREGTPGPS
ncbi:MAG TPA: cytochrome b/b6 domain-containing protein [Candidatus Latescibacteria bacterium]|nr:cytochrome b/b6 domain-containing protein [Candidatus Latescibacterota bacterium]